MPGKPLAEKELIVGKAPKTKPPLSNRFNDNFVIVNGWSIRFPPSLPLKMRIRFENVFAPVGAIPRKLAV